LELSYQSIKTANSVRESEDLRQETRKRNLLVLMLSHLSDNGYIEAAAALEKEANISLNRWQVCDNVDLDNILQEYESYYYIKFQKHPKITKKLASADVNKARAHRTRRRSIPSSDHSTSLPRISNGNQSAPIGDVSSLYKLMYHSKCLNLSKSSTDSTGENVTVKAADLGLTVSSVAIRDDKKNERNRKEIVDVRSMLNDAIRGASNDIMTNQSDRMVKPLGGFVGFNHEMRELATVISRDIYLHDPNVKWSDIVGLDHAKSLVKEAVVYPIKYPQLFTGILTPWKGILLYGPPGTGKTMLAKAVATECNTTFFNISASSIVSKWRGDSEKLVRVLFELARFHAPSTIFLDELESVMSQRGSGPGELDHAMLRRLEKRIIVDLPTHEARMSMFSRFLPPCNKDGGLVINTKLDYPTLAENTEGYSGSDLKLVCKEAAMRVVRKIFHTLESHQDGQKQLPDFSLETIMTNDVLDVLKHTKPSSGKLGNKYAEWRAKYESV
uniref:Katanin p60 ATPase-containing subunit A-like 2 n=1 Tax=Ciona intestinalis TaxID=7719 RepID=H2XYN2_CIOIN